MEKAVIEIEDSGCGIPEEIRRPRHSREIPAPRGRASSARGDRLVGERFQELLVQPAEAPVGHHQNHVARSRAILEPRHDLPPGYFWAADRILGFLESVVRMGPGRSPPAG